MEIRDLIYLIKNFENEIIDWKEYNDPWSVHYMFDSPLGNDKKGNSIEFKIFGNIYAQLKDWLNVNKSEFSAEDFLKFCSPLYHKESLIDFSHHWILLEHAAITKMYNNIEKKLNEIDVELTYLKMSKSPNYEFICDELLFNLISKIQSTYAGYNNQIPKQLIEHISPSKNNSTLYENSNKQTNYAKVEIETEKIAIQKKYKIRLLHQLGFFTYLQANYKKCKSNESEITRIVCKLNNDFKQESIQPYINDVMKSGLDNSNDKDLEIITYVNGLKN